MTDKPIADKLNDAIELVTNGVDLTRENMRRIVGDFLSGSAEADSMRSFLVALATKGESIDELVGAAEALRSSMVPVNSQRRPVVDTCGTGGDGAKTFNISTAAAIVTAAAGVPVAKHGNRKITSATGSADVLAELGINLDAQPTVVEECLNELGLCFCFAPRFHPAMRHVAEVRKSISHPTIFNRLGPLSNPASAECQVLGVGDPVLQLKLAAALQRLGTKRSIVVRGDDGVDELSISTSSKVLEVTGENCIEHVWHPGDFGLATSDRAELYADCPASSARCIRAVLDGNHGACRDAVVLNSACALWIVGASTDLRTCSQLAQTAIDTGAALRLLQKLGALSHRAS